VSEPETIHVVEWVSSVVPGLTEGEAAALEALGRELKGDSTWWGAPNEEDLESIEPTGTSVIRLHRRPGDSEWRIQVANAIGVIGVGNVQIIIHPKIGGQHFNFISSMALNPSWMRFGDGAHRLAKDESYLAAVWKSFLDALSISLKADLHRDYEEKFEEIGYVRGKMDVYRTSVNLARGILRFPSTFEDHTEDNPVNRTLRAAAQLVGRSLTLLGITGDKDPRGLTALRAWELLYRMGNVGELRPGDLDVVPPPLAVHQSRALNLAKHVLSGVGRTLRVGDVEVSCFLQPTPDLIEDGIRELLDDELGANVSVKKRRRTAARLSFSPDLVVEVDDPTSLGPLATGDVKYRMRKEDWPRSVLLQAMGFAQVFDVQRAFFVDFANDGHRETRSEVVSEVSYHHVTWPSGEDVSPEQSAEYVVSELRRVLLGESC
jgi:hypothetical protein